MNFVCELTIYLTCSLDGVLIAFDNVRRLQRTGHLIEHRPHIHLDIQADFIVFQPSIGAILKVGTRTIDVYLNIFYRQSVYK